nr:hypothetical protein Itr_chr02CG11140 [Ipomoea trifida]
MTEGNTPYRALYRRLKSLEAREVRNGPGRNYAGETRPRKVKLGDIFLVGGTLHSRPQTYVRLCNFPKERVAAHG